MLTQSFLHRHRDPLSLVLKNNSWLIPVPPLRSTHTSSPLCGNALLWHIPKVTLKAAPSFVLGMLFQLPWAASNRDRAL